MPKSKETEFIASVNVRKDSFTVFEIDQTSETMILNQRCKEGCRSGIGSNTCWDNDSRTPMVTGKMCKCGEPGTLMR